MYIENIKYWATNLASHFYSNTGKIFNLHATVYDIIFTNNFLASVPPEELKLYRCWFCSFEKKEYDCPSTLEKAIEKVNYYNSYMDYHIVNRSIEEEILKAYFA